MEKKLDKCEQFATVGRLKLLQVLLFSGFIVWRLLSAPPAEPVKDIPPPIPAEHLRLLALGEPELVAKLVSMWLLTVDIQAGQWLKLERLNYSHLSGWLQTIQNLDTNSDYPGMAASGIFIDVRDPTRMREMIDFVHRNFRQAPDKRWRWLAQCAVLAKYRLHDPALALELARSLRRHASPEALPPWARDMEFLLLQEIGEQQAARHVILGILQSGRALDPRERLFLINKLKELDMEL